MKEQIQAILAEEVPNAFTRINEVTSWGKPFHIITIAASDFEISGVRGQYSARVDLRLDEDLTLTVARTAMGGQKIYRNPRKEDPKEFYLALGSEKVPFRKPKKAEENVLRAVRKFAVNWREIVGSVIDEMRHHDQIDYKLAITK